MHNFFQLSDSDKELTHSSAHHALFSGSAVLISRLAFSSESETRTSYPPKLGEEALWRENAKPWYKERRHLFLACIDPATNQIITSSSEPNKEQAPWSLHFCADSAPLTTLDISVCLSSEMWAMYGASAVLLSKEHYPAEQIASVIKEFRKNKNLPIYSIDDKHGYDCQTGTRDVLWSTNPAINPSTLLLPPGTHILAYYSAQTVRVDLENALLSVV